MELGNLNLSSQMITLKDHESSNIFSGNRLNTRESKDANNSSIFCLSNLSGCSLPVLRPGVIRRGISSRKNYDKLQSNFGSLSKLNTEEEKVMNTIFEEKKRYPSLKQLAERRGTHGRAIQAAQDHGQVPHRPPQ
jgi:hypothetical protein